MSEALKQLHDLHLPAAPGFWPPAPGWWLLIALVITAMSWLGLRGYRRWRRQRPFRIALAALDELLRQKHQQVLAPDDFAHAVNALLKRALIHGASRTDVAPLTGTPWLACLDQILASDVFSNGAGTALGNARFAPASRFDADGLHAAARAVLRKLRTSSAV